MPADKLLSLRDAVARHVRDGDSVVIGACLEAAIPFAAVYEIIRQRKRGLDIIAPISDAATDMLIGAGCAAGITGAWVGNVSGGLGLNYRRAAEQGVPHRLTIRDHSNFSLAMALMASAYGLPYVPIRSLLGSDILKSNPELRTADDPFTGRPTVLVPPLRPDVAILAVQRADAAGNHHFWGNLGVAAEAALAADRIILLADEIVDRDVVTSDPNRPLVPGFRVSAVVHEPAAVHPAPLQGCWRRDSDFFHDYHARSRDRTDFLAWLDEWVFGVGDHEGYRARLGERLTAHRIAGAAPAATVNYAAR